MKPALLAKIEIQELLSLRLTSQTSLFRSCDMFVESAFQFGFCQKYFFQILSQKNAQIVNLKNPDLNLIRRIHPECGFYGFMIRFWICPQKRQNPFLDSEIRIWVFPKKRTLGEVNDVIILCSGSRMLRILFQLLRRTGTAGQSYEYSRLLYLIPDSPK